MNINPVLRYFLDAGETKLALIAVLFGVGFALEWAAPIAVVKLRERLFNCICGFFYHGADLFGALYLNALIAPLAKHPLIPYQVSDGHHVAFGILLAFVWLAVRDFFYYWFHRWQHTSKWLWAEHALHHSDEQMNITTAVRAHWLELPLITIFVGVPIAFLLHPPQITIPVAYVLTIAIGYLIHLNVRLDSGALAWVIASPQNHRIHHSRFPQHIDKNFAQCLPLWDVLFGTYYKPAPGEFPETGLVTGETVTTVGKALFMPFQTWAAMLRPSAIPEPATSRAAAGDSA